MGFPKIFVSTQRYNKLILVGGCAVDLLGNYVFVQISFKLRISF